MDTIAKLHTNLDNIVCEEATALACRPNVGDLIQMRIKYKAKYVYLKVVSVKHIPDNPRVKLHVELHIPDDNMTIQQFQDSIK